MNNTTSGKFSNECFNTVEQKISKPLDYIAVAGSAEGDWEISMAAVKNGLQQSLGNRYRFINQAIRALRSFPEPVFYCKDDINAPKFFKIQRILVIFQFKYTNNDVERIYKYAEKMGARVVYVKNQIEFITFLNERIKKGRGIKQLEIYSHGLVGVISFHYGRLLYLTTNDYLRQSIAPLKKVDEGYQQGVLFVSKILPTPISNNISKFYDYKNDMHNRINARHKKEMDKIRQSLKDGEFNKSSVDKVDPKIFAKDAVVISYACRTGISIDEESFNKPEDAKPEYSLAQYMADKWQVKVQAFEKRSNYEFTYKAMPGENVSDEVKKERKFSKNKREENEDNGGGPIMPKGAWHPPISGQTPKGVREGLLNYLPRKINE